MAVKAGPAGKEARRGGHDGHALVDPRRSTGSTTAVAIGAACVAVAGASLVLPVAPAYDPWTWLLWGREVTGLELSTEQGPAFKPLPVALTALLAPFGAAAPDLWLVVARVGALAALAVGFLVARRLAGGGASGGLAGTAAVTGIALTDGLVLHAAVGNSEPLLIALVLAAFTAALGDRHGWALALGGAAALLRPECWPFLAAYAAWRAWLDPRLRPAVLFAALAIPAAWLVPEWLGSGEPLRSGDRALTPNPGAPALDDRPALEALRIAGGLLFVPTAVAAFAAGRGAAALPAAAGAAWLVLVALMAEAGFSGEARYSLPGAALIAVSGGVGAARLIQLCSRGRARALPPALAAAGIALAATRIEGVAALAPRLAHDAALASSLPHAIEAAGGRDRLLACGRPAVGRFRGPLLAYRLGVQKHRVRADGRPGAVTFRSRARAGAALTPDSSPGARPRVTSGHWRIETACHRVAPTGGG